MHGKLADLHVDQGIVGFLGAPQARHQQERCAEREFGHRHARAVADQAAQVAKQAHVQFPIAGAPPSEAPKGWLRSTVVAVIV